MRGVVAAALLLAAAPAHAGAKSFRAVLDRTEAHLGDVVKCLIEVQHDEGEVYALPEPLELKPFRVRKVEVDRKPDHTTFTLDLQIFDVGEPEVPAIALTGPDKVEIPPQKIKVLSLIDEEAQAQAPPPAQPGAPAAPPPQPEFKDVKPPVPFRVQSFWLLWVLGSLAAAAAAAFLIYRAWKRRGRPAARAAPTRPPYEVAMERLQRLGREAPWTQGRRKEFYLEASEIVRGYLEARFGVLALEETTEELIEKLARAHTPGLDLDRFSAWCREGDLVKFARFEPTDGQCKQALEEAVRFVEATRPRPMPAAAPPGEQRAAA